MIAEQPATCIICYDNKKLHGLLTGSVNTQAQDVINAQDVDVISWDSNSLKYLPPS